METGRAKPERESDWPLTPDGIWLRVRRERSVDPAPALFLDRDGVIVDDFGYLSRPEDLRLLPGAAELIRAANAADMPVAVVTNQSGIARGMFGWAEFSLVEETLRHRLKEQDAVLDAVAACPFHADFTPGFGDRHRRWRKPGPAMMIAISERLNLDPAHSWMIGDKAIDIEAARNAGLAGAVHVLTGQGEEYRDAALALAGDGFAVFPAADAREALGILGKYFSGLAD